MNRFLCILSILGFLAVPVAAQESGIPAGVLIYDATPAAPVSTPSVVIPAVQALPSAPATTFKLAPAPQQPIRAVRLHRPSSNLLQTARFSIPCPSPLK